MKNVNYKILFFLITIINTQLLNPLQKLNLLNKCNSIIFKYFQTKNVQNSILSTYKLLSCNLSKSKKSENFEIEYLLSENLCRLMITKNDNLLKIEKKKTFCTKKKILPKIENFPISSQNKNTIHYLKNKRAICNIKNSVIKGQILFYQNSPFDKTFIKLQIKNLAKKSTFFLAINKYGNIENNCDSTGEFFAPEKKKKNLDQNFSFLGDLSSNGAGFGFFERNYDFSLSGEFSVVGRSVVLYKNKERLGSRREEMEKIACCVIGVID